MSKNPRIKEFPVQNYVRASIFLLFFTLAFFVLLWLIPFPFCLIGIASILLLLPIIHHVRTVNIAVHRQLFDRIKIKRFGIEYSAGVFGDSWSRPFNEFRVEYTEQNWLTGHLYRVRLKHRVLPNLIVASTLSQAVAEQTVADLIENSPLKLLKHQNS